MTDYIEAADINELIGLGPMPPVVNPYPIYKKLRDEMPVLETKSSAETSISGNERSVMLSRYEDIKEVLKNNDLFSSGINNRTMGLVMGETIVGMDGKQHLKHRTLVTPSMTTRALKGGEFPDEIRAIADSFIDKFIDDGACDIHHQFCYSYPLSVFVSILGLSSDDVKEFHDTSKDLCLVAKDMEKGVAASVWLENYLMPVVKEKRANPGDDMISVLVTSEVNGEKLTDIEVVSFLRLLTLAGAETTNHLLGTSFVAMLRDPELMDRVRNDRSLVPALLNEAMRWEAPISTIMRENLEECEIAGIKVPAKTAILCHLGSANRDERQFEDPDTFNIDRPDNDPLPFGYGPHYCAGSHLAKLEAEIGVNALLDRLDNIKAQPGEEFNVIGFSFRGPDRVPVTFDKIA